jgi:hypothetical protein
LRDLRRAERELPFQFDPQFTEDSCSKTVPLRSGGGFDCGQQPTVNSVNPQLTARDERAGASERRHRKVPIMTELFGLLFVSASLFVLLATGAQAWDGCGHGYHRD